jgi:hypothetical protein
MTQAGTSDKVEIPFRSTHSFGFAACIGVVVIMSILAIAANNYVLLIYVLFLVPAIVLLGRERKHVMDFDRRTQTLRVCRMMLATPCKPSAVGQYPFAQFGGVFREDSPPLWGKRGHSTRQARYAEIWLRVGGESVLLARTANRSDEYHPVVEKWQAYIASLTQQHQQHQHQQQYQQQSQQQQQQQQQRSLSMSSNGAPMAAHQQQPHHPQQQQPPEQQPRRPQPALALPLLLQSQPPEQPQPYSPMMHAQQQSPMMPPPQHQSPMQQQQQQQQQSPMMPYGQPPAPGAPQFAYGQPDPAYGAQQPAPVQHAYGAPDPAFAPNQAPPQFAGQPQQ